jgi:signal transduction histidine kinase
VTVAPSTASSGHDLDGLARPLLEALAKIASLDATYLAVFDWDTREQEVRFLHSTEQVGITDRSRLPLAAAISRESLPGVTRSPLGEMHAHPDGEVAKHVGLATYVSVPIVLAGHELWGMVCGASRQPQPQVSDRVITVMEAFAEIIAEHVSWERAAATERRAEAAEAELRSRGRFLAQAQHQLKTPLTALRGAVELLQTRWDRLSDEERQQWFAMTSRSADALSADIDGLLDEALADLRRRELVPADVDVATVAAPMIRAFDALTDRHEVRWEVEERLRAWVDPMALSQVLGHLLDNAVKFSPNGGPVRVSGRSTPGTVEISVVDQGLGLPDGIDIFQPFQRGKHDSVPGPGVGLGLHIVRGLVEASGGSVTATPNSVAGSTFTVRLPSRA